MLEWLPTVLLVVSAVLIVASLGLDALTRRRPAPSRFDAKPRRQVDLGEAMRRADD